MKTPRSYTHELTLTSPRTTNHQWLVMLVERLEALVEEVARVREVLISMKPSP